MSDSFLNPIPSSGTGSQDHTESQVLEAYRDMARTGPPAALDSRILGNARRHASSRDGKKRGLRHNWMMPLGLAASALLALSLVLETAQQPVGTAPLERESATQDSGRRDIPARARPQVLAPVPTSALPSTAEADSIAPAPAAEALQAMPATAPAETDKLEMRQRRANAGAMKSSGPPTLDPEDWMAQVKLMLERGDVEGARQELERLLALYPQRADARQLLDSLSLDRP